nr:hypothetical protein [Entomoplasma sp. MP1]
MKEWGTLELAEPVTHIWMVKVFPPRIASLLDLKSKELEEVVYYFVSHCFRPRDIKTPHS